ncbi:SMP-30/Gluconolaconase/LRE-like region-containing protein [Gemmatirosa kalamazoonensis]|uniref:SMP-30/Gluconolaconase/LRE-like region-containing protein n=1 Tax=Gemmatirosa kalamazoonensis TaxID=861299 RepID=W0RJ25_9BACT|nr:SMP-30/gluconolactonase/LRE family protein [Gemmatirosa kalamazoonensis]AHG89413.1 SMP-30/Gluconolaconase/LRE-like region-containing protein [Gemmatirosa kalamazoonensis]
MRPIIGALLALVALRGAGAQETGSVPAGRPAAIVDLATPDGARLVSGTWRYHDAAIVPVDRTHDVAPQAGAADFDDAAWETIAPDALDARRGGGRLSFSWYRLRFTIPERVGSLDPTGATVVFEVVVDDYSEVWVDGRLPQVLGASGAGLARGWNAPNRVIVARDVRPGQTFQLAVFGANAPLSQPPANFVWIRSATLEFHSDASLGVRRVTGGEVKRLRPEVDAIVPRDATIERIATGFQFTEGPVWHPDGYLLFSDPNANTIYRWSPDGQVSVFRPKSGYAGVDVGEYGQPGSNGLTLDAEGRLTIDEHGRRRVVRLERRGQITVLADRHDGRRLNSPNDLVYKSDGALYFTDPPFGLPKFFDDPRKELPYSGVYRVANGEVRLVARDLTGPNGLAFSPDERFVYVDDWDVARKVIMRYPVLADGSLGAGAVFADVTRSDPGEQAWDGLKVDREGHVYAAGPGGIWIFAPDGTHLGTISPPETPANFAWGDADGRTLYITARTSLYRIRLSVPGVRPWPAPSTQTALTAQTTRSRP